MEACDAEGAPPPELTAGDPSGRRPLVIWDADCGLCRRAARHLRALSGERLAFEPYQTAAARFPEVPEQRFRESVYLAEPGGRLSRGAEAVVRALELGGGRSGWRLAYERLPGFAALAERGYALVASHRSGWARILQLLVGDRVGPLRYRATRWIFLRALGGVFLVAFASVAVQVDGLAGSEGLTPACAYLERAEESLGSERAWRLPTLLWLGCGDRALAALLAAGAVAAALLALGAVQGPALLACFLTYLSLFHAVPTFLSFQWDVLLLETAFLSLFLAPWRTAAPRRPGREPPPSEAGIWLLRLLLFKLMFSSGVTKLTWNDPTWRDLSALTFHYWTQPLPTSAAWLAHRLPLRLHELSCAVMYAIEIALPWLAFAPRRPRLAAACGIALFQLAIAATGHYGFFNLLTLVLCVALLDDDLLPAALRPRPGEPAPVASPRRAAPRAVLATAVAALSIVPITSALAPSYWRERPDHPLRRLRDAVRPFALSGEYGLFRVMTTTRPELELQGRTGSGEWRPYRFRYKPGDVAEGPRWAQPHMPRLDWQMWFAALHAERAWPYGEAGLRHWLGRQDPWLPALVAALLERNGAVLDLLDESPFGERGPDQVRLVLWQYGFAPASSPQWWVRERVGVVGTWSLED